MTITPAEASDNTEIQKIGLINLYIAEYQSLTTRQSYWMILHVSLVPVIPVYLTLAAQLWERIGSTKIIAWGTFGGLQLIGYLWAHVMVEYYTTVRYLECVLRPPVKRTIEAELFWGYEPHLSAHRSTSALSWELFFPILGSVIMATISIFRLRDWIINGGDPAGDIFGATINLGLLAAQWWPCLSAGRIRRQWSSCSKEVSEQLDATVLDIKLSQKNS